MLTSEPAKTVLVVEDDPVTSDAMARLLRGAGYGVATAANGWEALRRVGDQRPGVILLDLVMPGLDGWGFCEALHADPANARIPVVVCSGASPELQQSGTLSLRVDEFHPKPVDIDALLGTIRRLCG